MVDIAEVGFRADTDELDVANQKMKALKPSAEGVEKASENLNKKLNKTNGVFGKLAMGGNTVNSVFGKLAGGVKSLATGLLGIATGVIAGFAFANMIDGARDLSSALAELATLLPANSAELANMQAAARAMADEFGTTAAFQIQAFYGAVSAGATDAAAAIAIVDTANKLAIGGITDVATGVDILTTATNAYAASGLLASSASDALFVGMRAGKTTIGELAGGLGNVIPIAAALGVEFDELVAGTAALTLQGLSTSTAITSLRAILSGVAKPTAEASKLATELGLDFSTTALRAKGLAGFLQDVVDKTGGSADKLSVMFGSVEALNAALAFAGAGGESFNQILGDMADKAGATDQALTTVQQSLDNRWGIILAKLNNLAIDFGYALLSVIVPAAEAVSRGIEHLSDNADILKIVLISLAFSQIPAMAAGLSAIVLGMNSAAIATGVFTGAINLARIAVVALGGPIGLIWAAIGALGAAFVIFNQSQHNQQLAIDNVTLALKDEITQMGQLQIAMAPGTAMSLEAANAKLQEAMAIREKIAAGVDEQRQIILQSEAYQSVVEQIRNYGEALSGIRPPGDDIEQMPLRMREAYEGLETSLVQALNKQQDLLAAVDVLSPEYAEAGKMISELQNAIASAKNGQVVMNGSVVEGISLSERLSSVVGGINFSSSISGANALAEKLGVSLNLARSIAATAGSSNVGDEVFDPRSPLFNKDAQNAANRQAELDRIRASFENVSTSIATSGSGGGGGSASAIADETTQLQRLQEQYSKLSEPINQTQSAYSALDDALSNGSINNDQFTESLSRIQDAFLATGGSAEQWAKIVNGQTDSVAQKMRDLGEKTLGNLGDEFIDLAVDGEASFGDLAKSIIKNLLKIAWQALVVKPILDSLGNLGGGGSGGGFFGTILKGITSLFSAKGNAFGQSGVDAFANGGAFSNSVVSGATPFLFGKGGADLGIMGEAGPEAVMPLQRGADGSLGVQMYGGKGSGQPASNNVEVTNVYKIEGAVSEEKVVANIRAAGEKTKEDVRQSVVGWLNEYDQNGTM